MSGEIHIQIQQSVSLNIFSEKFHQLIVFDSLLYFQVDEVHSGSRPRFDYQRPPPGLWPAAENKIHVPLTLAAPVAHPVAQKMENMGNMETIIHTEIMDKIYNRWSFIPFFHFFQSNQ